ncbi:alpha/beta fold hydrolase [Streptomyces sp. IB2014 016-6]|uniref:thioesterase II family protein n=1 Tax=Streptomyces sp. IB2014 016-6 TaxID=2517818 RepID=UPI0011CCB636|nr:alpha/beta fold hydrolase [Streptomyces sp. IB2014 016-6]TXL87787.1 thioesterase [Streptomyces sp. IB2014 016-6]
MTAVADRDSWFRRYEPASPDAVQLLCLPHAGGAAPQFLSMARELAPAVDVVCVQYPGRQERRKETPIDDIRTLADRIEELLALRPEQRLVILGHSMGAVVGFELALRIQRSAPGTLLGLIASGRRAPVIQREESVHRRGDDGIIAEIRALSGTDPSLLADDELLRMALPALRADYRAVETYRYREGDRLSVPIGVMLGDSDPRVSLDDARAWEQLTDDDFSMRTFPGGHFYLNTQQTAAASAVADLVAAFQDLSRTS